MQQAASIRIMSGRRTVVLNISAILYVRTSGHNSEIHVSGGQVYVTRQSLTALERQLGAGDTLCLAVEEEELVLRAEHRSRELV